MGAQEKLTPGFGEYDMTMLVWYEHYDRVIDARHRVQIKWRREWKMKLIEEMNPEWRDFYEDLNK